MKNTNTTLCVRKEIIIRSKNGTEKGRHREFSTSVHYH